MIVSLKKLSTHARERVEGLVEEAGLPDVLPWADGVHVQDLSKNAGAMARFVDGKYSVRPPGGSRQSEITIDGGVTEEDCRVEWVIKINTENGEVMARPRAVGACKNRRSVNWPELGLTTRQIAVLGPFERLIPEISIVEHYGLPDVWAPVNTVREDRRLLGLALLRECS